jgi:hypothetical protein
MGTQLLIGLSHEHRGAYNAYPLLILMTLGAYNAYPDYPLSI